MKTPSDGEKLGTMKGTRVDCFPPVGSDRVEVALAVPGLQSTPAQGQPSGMVWTGARPGAVLVPTATASTTSAPKRPIEPLALARAFRRRWLPATLLGIVLGTIAGAVTWIVVPAAKYTATARLHVASVAPMVMYKTKEPAPEYATFRQTQLALLKSQQVIDTALSQDEVKALQVVRSKADPAEWLQEQLSVTFSNGSEVLEIAMSGDEPKALAVLVNAVTAAYLQEVVNVDHSDRQKRLEGLRGFWKKYEEDLHQKQERLRKIAEAVGTNDKTALTLQQQYDIDRQDLIRRNLIEIHAELLKHRAELELAADRNRKSRDASDREVPDMAIEEELGYDPIIASHVKRIREPQGGGDAELANGAKPGDGRQCHHHPRRDPGRGIGSEPAPSEAASPSGGQAPRRNETRRYERLRVASRSSRHAGEA